MYYQNVQTVYQVVIWVQPEANSLAVVTLPQVTKTLH